MTNKKKEGSTLSQILIRVVVALLVSGTIPWWWPLIFREKTINYPPPKQTTEDIPNKPEPPIPVPNPGLESPDWGNLSDYFVIKKVNLKRGYGQGSSELNFLVEAKGNFSGSMYAYVSDEDGVKICSLNLGLECMGYEFVITFSTKSNSLLSDPFLDDIYGYNDPFNYTWQKGEVERASLTFPYNAKKIKFVFKQSDI